MNNTTATSKAESIERQDIQEVNYIAGNLIYLLQTIFEHHEKLDKFQLPALIGMAYDLSARIHSWTDEEERIVLKLEERERLNG